MRTGSKVVVYGLSVALHASLGLGVAEIEPHKEPDRIAITVIQAPKPKQKKVEPPPPAPVEAPEPVAAPVPTPAPKAKAPVARAEAPAPPVAAPPPVAPAAPTFGIAMTGGVGQGGVAVPTGDGLGGSPAPATKRVAVAKTLLQPKAEASGCEEPTSKPKPLALGRPEYTDEARAAAVEGRVRVELTVDAQGVVSQVKVLEGLGHGLDEAAVRAVQAASFEPALACGKAVSATFVVSIRFSL